MEKPRKDALKLQLETYSNEEIEDILESKNWRKINYSWRDVLVGYMLNGKWRVNNGETLAFDSDGDLMNGQHRLSAAAVYQQKTGKKAWFWVLSGVERATESTVDGGQSRTLTQKLRVEEVPYPNRCAALAVVLGRLSKAKGKLVQQLFTRSIRITTGEGLDMFRRNRGDIEKWARYWERFKGSGLVLPSIIASTMLLIARRHNSDAFDFADQLVSGAGLDKTDPVFLLRERLIRLNQDAMNRPQHFVIGALCIKAFNAWVQGRPLSNLRYAPTGPKPENWPELVKPDEASK